MKKIMTTVLLLGLVITLTACGLGRPSPPDSALSFVPGLTHGHHLSLLNREVRGGTALYTYQVRARDPLFDGWFWRLDDGEGILTLEWDSNRSEWTYSGFEWTRREYTDRTLEVLEGQWFVHAGFGASFNITISNVTETSATVEWEHTASGGRTAWINGELFGIAECTIRFVDDDSGRYYVIDGIVLDHAIVNNLWEVIRQDRFYFRVSPNSFDAVGDLSTSTTNDLIIRRRTT